MIKLSSYPYINFLRLLPFSFFISSQFRLCFLVFFFFFWFDWLLLPINHFYDAVFSLFISRIDWEERSLLVLLLFYFVIIFIYFRFYFLSLTNSFPFKKKTSLFIYFFFGFLLAFIFLSLVLILSFIHKLLIVANSKSAFFSFCLFSFCC